MAIKYNPMLPIPQTTLRTAPTIDQLITNRLARQAGVRKPTMPMPQGNLTSDIDMARKKREMQMRILQAQAAQAQKQRQQVQPQQQEQQKQGGFQMPSAMSPAGQALGAAAATGLQLSGYSTMPRTFGQNIGAMMASADKAYTDAQDRSLANYLNTLKAEAALQKAKGGQFFQGQSQFSQIGNTLLSLAPKIKSGKATPSEQATYAYAYGVTQKPMKQITFDELGNQVITEIPAQDLPVEMFPKPAGARKLEVTEKPSTEQVKKAYKLKDSLKMLQNLNDYRNTLLNPDFTVGKQIGGMVGFPDTLAATAESQAEALRLDIKNLYELGALVGGDFQILDNMLKNPNSPKAIQAGKDALLVQLDNLEKQLTRDFESIANVELEGTFANPIIAKSMEDYENAPNTTYIKLPDGRIVLKGVK